MKPNIQTGFVNAHCDIHTGIENVYAEMYEMVQV